MTVTSQDSKLSIQFLPLTSNISAPFIPKSIRSLREEYANSKSAIIDSLIDENDAQALRMNKERALSDASDIVLAEPLHARADSS